MVTDLHEVSAVAEATSVEEDGDLGRIQALIRDLRGVGPVQVWRKQPTWCAGFLTTIHVGPGEVIDLEALKQDWGGSVLQLRPQQYTDKGVKYAKGGGSISISGPPRYHGREISPDGWAAPTPTQPVPATRPATGVDPVMQMMMTMFGQMMSVVTANMAAAAAPQRRAPASRDEFDQFERVMGLFGKFEQFRSSFTREDEEEDEEPPSGGLEGKFLEFMLNKLDDKPKKSAPVAPARPSPGAGWRLHKAGTKPAAAAAPAGPQTPAQLLAIIRKMPPEQQMELLGQASQAMDPALIQEWMAANGMGEAVGS